MTVKELAEIVGKNPQAVREWLKKPDCPVGTAFKTGTGKKNYLYIIYEKKVGELFCRETSLGSSQSD